MWSRKFCFKSIQTYLSSDFRFSSAAKLKLRNLAPNRLLKSWFWETGQSFDEMEYLDRFGVQKLVYMVDFKAIEKIENIFLLINSRQCFKISFGSGAFVIGRTTSGLSLKFTEPYQKNCCWWKNSCNIAAS